MCSFKHCSKYILLYIVYIIIKCYSNIQRKVGMTTAFLSLVRFLNKSRMNCCHWKHFTDVRWCLSMKGSKSQNQNLKVGPEVNRQPVRQNYQCCDMWVLGRLSEDSHSGALNNLQTLQGGFLKTSAQRVTLFAMWRHFQLQCCFRCDCWGVQTVKFSNTT